MNAGDCYSFSSRCSFLWLELSAAIIRADTSNLDRTRSYVYSYLGIPRCRKPSRLVRFRSCAAFFKQSDSNCLRSSICEGWWLRKSAWETVLHEWRWPASDFYRSSNQGVLYIIENFSIQFLFKDLKVERTRLA